jgi:hypothetical protein
MGAITKTHVEVYNAIGQMIGSQEFTAQTTTIDLGGFEAGIYSVKVIANNKNVVKKITVVK